MARKAETAVVSVEELQELMAKAGAQRRSIKPENVEAEPTVKQLLAIVKHLRDDPNLPAMAFPRTRGEAGAIIGALRG